MTGIDKLQSLKKIKRVCEMFNSFLTKEISWMNFLLLIHTFITFFIHLTTYLNFN